MTPRDPQLSESYIQDAFHSYLKSSLTQAKAERLLDADVLSSAEGDLMITGESYHCIRIFIPKLIFFFQVLHFVSTLLPYDVPQIHPQFR